jgi:hypothetical protein
MVTRHDGLNNGLVDFSRGVSPPSVAVANDSGCLLATATAAAIVGRELDVSNDDDVDVELQSQEATAGEGS